LVSVYYRKEKKRWQEWLSFDDLEKKTYALIDDKLFAKVFREQKLERILNEDGEK
jgi:predicted SAM-dependent methyltransferase